MENNSSKIWEKILKILRLKLGEMEYRSWLLNIRPSSIDEKTFTIEVDNNFMKDKVEKDYKIMINEILNNILYENGSRNIEIFIKESSDLSFKEKINKLSKYDRVSGGDGPNSKYDFSNFVVGKSNEFAHAASEGVSISPGKVYNPLFIYGGVGLGKTHLMHAIGNYIKQGNPEAKIHYCSSEQFTNDLINSLKRDKMPQFREKYRKLDVLLIDDIQFIAGKESTQEEFFYTFNALHQYSRQIVISSDRPPQEIKNIEERLVSRFAWGLIADIKAPDYETRVAILKNKAEMEDIDIPEDAINYIAEAITSNIRELEGALNRVVAKSSLLGRAIDFDLIKDVFKGFLEDKAKKVTKSKILKCVSDFYNIPISEMESNKRKKDIAKSRQVSMYFLRNMLNLPFAAIGDLFGGRDHTTVMHSVNKIDSEIAYDKNLNLEINQVKQNIIK